MTMEWENGEITPEPLSIIAMDAPVACAVYARDNNLLDKPGWKRFRKIAKSQKKLLRMVNQSKLRLFCTAPKYMYICTDTRSRIKMPFVSIDLLVIPNGRMPPSLKWTK